MNSGIGLQRFFHRTEIASRTVQNIRHAGELLGVEPDQIEELLDPQDLHVYRLHVPLGGRMLPVWGCTVFHNRARGVYHGGIRICDDANVGQTLELARLMSLKSALLELELGGAKTGLLFDLDDACRLLGREEYDREFVHNVKRLVLREFARHYRDLLARGRYVPCPGFGTGPEELVVIYDETKNPLTVTGKPEGVPGWLPGRREAAGYGVAFIARKCLERQGQTLDGVRVALQGWGAVASAAARFLSEAGAKIVAAADHGGGVFDGAGLDIEALGEHKLRTGTVGGFPGEPLEPGAVFGVACDLLIPAANCNEIDEDIAGTVRAKHVIEGGNFALTRKALLKLASKGVEVVPDLIANAGGAVASAEEHGQGKAARQGPEAVYELIEKNLGRTLELAWAVGSERKLNLDLACTLIAVERLLKSMRSHGWI